MVTNENLKTSRREKKAVVLLSGGMDSAVTLALALKEGYECHTMYVDYGQTNKFERDASRKLSECLGGVGHFEIQLDLRRIGGSALLGDGEIPLARIEAQREDIPETYVPARNTILLSLAVAWAEVLGAEAVFIGVNAVDYSGYPDCRREFIDSFAKVVELGTKSGVAGKPIKIIAPLVDMKKSEIVRLGYNLGVDFGLTTSCYKPDASGKPCKECESCALRKKAFVEAGLLDPIDLSN